MKKICILDYGLGNVRSLFNSLKKIGFDADFFSSNKNLNYDIIFIPGVGSYSKASELILQKKYLDFLNIHNKGAIIFGICLGMQLFSSNGSENGINKGLNFIKGETKKFSNKEGDLILPFVGYNEVKFVKNSKYSFINKFNMQKFYFVHSYHFIPQKKSQILSTTKNHGVTYCSSVLHDRYLGTQFHPEKSGSVGLEFLSQFIKNI
tara:strand:+ start:8020 stop:8637 length:618 start_codon:yes stop_codon:yes gene_type:complete